MNPRCEICGAGGAHVVANEHGGHRWLCAACEYAELYPGAPRLPAEPRARTVPLQTEKLFHVPQVRRDP